MHTDLKQRFLGQYAAICNGALVDSDADRAALARRVRRQYGNAAVLITRVEPEPEREFTLRSPRFERGV